MVDTLDQTSDDAPAPSRSRRWLWAGLAVAVAVVAFVMYWFQPHTLFIDNTVVEELPTAAPPERTETEPDRDRDDEPDSASAEAEPVEPVEPSVLATGAFTSLDKGTSGSVRVLELADGSRYLRLEDLDTSNGPDLFVYLSTNPADGPKGAFKDDYVNLGTLKGNKGDQNYELSRDLDWERFTSVVIYCDRFSSPFGAADLSSPL